MDTRVTHPQGRSSKQVAGRGSPHPPNAGKGRKKGSRNKLTKAAKEAFEYAFEQIGGADKLAEWANANQTEFYRLYARLIPVENRHGDLEGKSVPALGYIVVPPKKSHQEAPAN